MYMCIYTYLRTHIYVPLSPLKLRSKEFTSVYFLHKPVIARLGS